MPYVIASHRTALLIATILLPVAAILMHATTGDALRMPVGLRIRAWSPSGP